MLQSPGLDTVLLLWYKAFFKEDIASSLWFTMPMYLGINGFSHDASACLIDEKGLIIAAVEEERFTGAKHGAKFPIESVKFCLNNHNHV
jgi:hypothetical protein